MFSSFCRLFDFVANILQKSILNSMSIKIFMHCRYFFANKKIMHRMNQCVLLQQS